MLPKPIDGRLMKVSLANDAGPMVIQQNDIHAIEATSDQDRADLGTDGKSCIYLAPIALDSSRIFVTESVEELWRRLNGTMTSIGCVSDG